MKRIFAAVLLCALVFHVGNIANAEQGFNYQCYLSANPDLPQTWGAAECINHYKYYGFLENRAGCFNLEEYLNANPDLPKSWGLAEALNHYNMFGKFEHRLLAFDAQEYLSLYSDLPQSWIYDQAFNHYINYGSKEGRIASFDEKAYLEMYPDLPQSWEQAEAFYHYQYYGKKEGRVYDPYDEAAFGTKTEPTEGFSYEKVSGKAFRSVYEKYGCEAEIRFIDNSRIHVVENDGEIFTMYYKIENGVIRILSNPGSEQTSITLLSEDNGVFTVEHEVSLGTDSWVEERQLCGIKSCVDFSKIGSNGAEGILNWVLQNGIYDCVVKLDGTLSCEGASFESSWWISNGAFYFDYNGVEESCMDTKAYKIEDSKLYFATDADYSIIVHWYLLNEPAADRE
jgi:hypothetical protein